MATDSAPDNTGGRPRKKTRFARLRRVLRWTSLILAILLICSIGAGWLFVQHSRSNLPPLPDLEDLRPDYGTRIQSQDGVYLGGEHAVEPVPYAELPPLLIAAFLAAEDEDFFQHDGYNIRSIMRAAFDNYRAGRSVQGASTITQQVAKHFIGDHRSLPRKFQELLLARELEVNYTKPEILSAYLGGIYFGQQSWGVTQAAYRYFDVPPGRLSVGQMATLAGVLPAPSVYNPVDNPQLALRERNRVLRRMHEVGILTKSEKEQLRQQPLEGPVPAPAPVSPVPEAVGTVLRSWEELGRGQPWEASSLEVITTHSAAHQARARKALREGIEAHDRRSGYRGAPARAVDVEAVDRAIDNSEYEADSSELVLARIIAVEDDGLLIRIPGGEATIEASRLSWIHGMHPRTERPRTRGKRWSQYFEPDDVIFARRLPSDPDQNPEDLSWSLWQWPDREGAVMVADHHSSEVLASVGAYDVGLSRFHRAEQSCRQPGSLFKTILYAEAFSRGVTPATLLSDVPTDVDSRSGVWQPRNADHDFRGYITALDAFASSRNIATVNLASYVGIHALIERARRMGVQSLLDPTPSLALGASCTKLPEMLRVHAAIARGGLAFEEQNISHVRNISTGQIRDYGHFLQRDPALLPRIIRASAPIRSPDRVVSPPITALMHRALRDVVTRGTAHALPNEWPVSGKTGTSNDFDAWFAVFDPDIISTVWVGSDQNDRPFESGEHGGTVALPIFANYYTGMAPDIDQWPPSPGPNAEIETIRIDPATGLRARTGESGIEYPFMRNTAPRQYAPTSASRQLERFDSLVY